MLLGYLEEVRGAKRAEREIGRYVTKRIALRMLR